ncbi:MAG: sugar ABC transporter ATP-binding protein [Fimbriimonadaceae bacterium]
MSALLEMKSMSRRFGATVALDGVNFAVNAGEVHAIVGENGSGKSTLMRVLAGALKPDSGAMTLGGNDYRPGSPVDARRAGVAMIHQELTIAPHLSVLENVLLGVEAARMGWISRRAGEARARPALNALGLGELPLDKPAGKLPIATQQLVEIARALVLDARLVVLDEPTSSLTEADVERLFAVMRELRAKGYALVYISHFLNEVRAIADTMTVLRDGKTIGERPVAGITDDEIVSMMVGRDIGDLYPRQPHVAGEQLLDVAGLAGRRMPVNASVGVSRGEVVGIAGLNGSGRSELVRAIFGLDAVRAGTIRIGVYKGVADPRHRWRQGVGMLSEDRKEEGVALGLSIAENIVMSSMKPGLVSPPEQREIAKKWIDRLSIKCQGPDQAVRDLSGGNQQKVALARMLHANVDLMLLDEPTRGIDVGSKEQIYRLIDEAALAGKAVLVVSSYLPELLGVCDRIAVMHRGTLGEARSAALVTQESLMHEAVGA